MGQSSSNYGNSDKLDPTSPDVSFEESEGGIVAQKLFFLKVGLYLCCCRCLQRKRPVDEQPERHVVLPESKVLLLGLDGAGKSSILERMQSEYKSVEFGANDQALQSFGTALSKEVAPTNGFTIKQLRVPPRQLNIWEVGGTEKLRGYWSKYTNAVRGLVYTIDGCDKARLDESIHALRRVLSESYSKHWPVLVLVNKSDVLTCVTTEQVETKLENILKEVLPTVLTVRQVSCVPDGLDCTVPSDMDKCLQLSEELENAFKWLALVL